MQKRIIYPNQNSRFKPTLKEQGFYKKAVWVKLRNATLIRDNYLCQECLRRKRITKATEVHHVRPLETYPDLALDINNLESLCRECHERTKGRGAAIDTLPVRVIRVRDGSELDNEQVD